MCIRDRTYDLLRQWTGIRPPWGKRTGVRPVRLIHDKRAAGWSEEQKENDYADVAAMLEKCHLLAEAGYRPYYLYRHGGYVRVVVQMCIRDRSGRSSRLPRPRRISRWRICPR